MEHRNINGIECPIVTKFLPPSAKWIVIWDGFIICFAIKPTYNKEEKEWVGNGDIVGRLDYYNELICSQSGIEDVQDGINDEEKYIWKVV